MKADLYIRVSTDEQADKGYSQRDQEERLRRYCEIKEISVRKIIFEDHSAKTFNRPEWNDLLADLKKKYNRVDHVLFTKWDRFSRNAGDAYQMINLLRRQGVEPQAIEQPLDLSVPENKMMLAFYLAAPEVENDRRALNVTHGMRRAKKEGRYMGVAPFGYQNKATEDGRKFIAIVPEHKEVVQWIFETIALGQYAVEQVFRLACEKGFDRTKNAFWTVLRNPVYCGKILIPRFKEEGEVIVKGNHEAIISEALFWEVQDLLDGKKKVYRSKVGSQEEMQLRGHLICPTCGKLLTGSASKGRKLRYYYYHCTAECGVRYKAEIANQAFIEELTKFVPRAGMVEVYAKIINDMYKEEFGEQGVEVAVMTKRIAELTEDINKARRKFLTDKVNQTEYQEFKRDCEKEIERLESSLVTASMQTANIYRFLTKAMENMIDAGSNYLQYDTEGKRRIVGSMFPEKLVFDGTQHRTARMNEAVVVIFNVDAGFGGNKNGEIDMKINFSSLVARPGFEPRQTEPKSVVLPLYYRAIRSFFSEWGAKIGGGGVCSKKIWQKRGDGSLYTSPDFSPNLPTFLYLPPTT